jgi:hypothetical protein
MNTYAKDIIKELDHVTASGNRPSVIFEDWLEMTHATLQSIPAHLRAAITRQEFAPDTEETAKLFQRMRERYKSAYCWERFANAFYILLDSADGEEGTINWDDTIGQVYMEWGIPNKHTGQFFTPYHVARLMAMLQDIPEQVYRHLEQAWLKSPEGNFHLLLTSPDRVSKFIRESPQAVVQFCAEYFERIMVNDCACGSGVMLLAAAEQTPRWALDWGLVQFTGQDIDYHCVLMCQVNMMIYGLNGYNLKNEIAIAEALQQSRTTYEVREWQQPTLMEILQ